LKNERRKKTMKKAFLFLLVFLMTISLVLGAQGNAGTSGQQGIHDPGTGITNPEVNEAGQGTGQGLQSNTETETQNQGTDTALQNQIANQEQIRAQSGKLINSNGEEIQLQKENGIKLRVRDVEAYSSLEIIPEQDQEQNRTRLKIQLSNGKNAEIKVMPNTASERAIERLQLKNCNSDNNCSIQLKEVGNGEQVKAAYEVQAQKETRANTEAR